MGFQARLCRCWCWMRRTGCWAWASRRSWTRSWAASPGRGAPVMMVAASLWDAHHDALLQLLSQSVFHNTHHPVPPCGNTERTCHSRFIRALRFLNSLRASSQVSSQRHKQTQLRRSLGLAYVTLSVSTSRCRDRSIRRSVAMLTASPEQTRQ